MKIKWWSFAGMMGSEREGEVIIEDEEIEELCNFGMTEEEIEEWIDKQIREVVFDYFEWGYDIVE